MLFEKVFFSELLAAVLTHQLVCFRVLLFVHYSHAVFVVSVGGLEGFITEFAVDRWFHI